MPDQPTTSVQRIPARAALAGNPSDGYGGAVLAVPVRSVGARVAARPAAGLSIDGVGFDSLDDLRVALDGGGTGGLVALAAATVDLYAAEVGMRRACALELSTTIPRSLGLAGSSAVVIGVLRCLFRLDGRAEPAADDLAAMALAVEVERLGIAAGLQDRLVQSHDAALHMEFDGRGHRSVEVDGALHLFVAARPGTAAPSGSIHGPLRARFERGDADVDAAMAQLADQARRATAALTSGDVGSLGAAIDRSFDLRRSIVDLAPAHVEMIETARAAGAAANFAGSGGSITVLAPDRRIEARARAMLAALGCRLLDLPAP